MKFYLTKLIDDKQQFFEISKDDFERLKKSRESLFQALFIEEKLEIILGNYVEYEMELLHSSANQMLFGNQDWVWFTKDINRISRRIINLHTSSRLYIDQLAHHFSTIYGSTHENVSKLKSQISKEYDRNLNYRIMSALRNYVQHRSFPIAGCKYVAKKIENTPEGEPDKLYTLMPYLKLDDLKADKKFKQSVAQEMESLGQAIDIKPIIRGYISSIGNIHNWVRKTLKADIQSWEKCLSDFTNQLTEKFGLNDNTISYYAVAYNEKNVQQEVVTIFEDFIKHRQELEKKNRNFSGLSMQFITSQYLKGNG